MGFEPQAGWLSGVGQTKPTVETRNMPQNQNSLDVTTFCQVFGIWGPSNPRAVWLIAKPRHIDPGLVIDFVSTRPWGLGTMMLEVAGKIPQKPPAWITLSFGGIAAEAFFDPQAGLAVRTSDIRNFPEKLLVQPLTTDPTISNPGAPPSASLLPGPRGPIDLRPVRP